MTAWKEMGSGVRALWIGGAAAAVSAAGALIWIGQQAPAPVPPAAQPEASAPAVQPEVQAAVEPAQVAEEPVTAVEEAADAEAAAAPAGEEPAAAPEAEQPAATTTGEPAEAAAPPAADEPAQPAFDVVRVDPDGGALVAGRAEPGAAVKVRVDGADAAETPSDAQGKFVALFTLPPSTEPRFVTLLSVLPDGREIVSADSVLIAPTPAAVLAAPEATEPASPAPAATESAAVEPAATETAEAEPAAPAPETAETVAEAAPEAAEEPPVAPSPEAVAEVAAPEPVAPAALLVTEEGAKVLQTGTAEAGDLRNITIDAISYSTKGDVQLAGRGQADGFVRLYLDNTPLMEARIAPDGTWGGTLPAVAAGLYTLRADQLNAQGRVESRYETPFQREAPEVLAAAAPEGDTGPGGMAAKITVQPGFTLWGIARQNYGSGVMYVQVYEANKNLIRDPDLIYPGQVFSVPAQN